MVGINILEKSIDTPLLGKGSLLVGLDRVASRGPRRIAPDEDVHVPVSDLSGGDRRLLAWLSPGPSAVKDEVRALIRREEAGK
jgi:hypothetical protein